jgi:hypothetical protein
MSGAPIRPPFDLSSFPPPLLDRPRPLRLAEPQLSIGLPVQQYKPIRIVPIPFDPRTSNGAKFETLIDAMTFIAKHSQFHHQAFNKNLARLYLPFCRVMNLSKGGFTVPVHLAKKEFNAAFNAAGRFLSNRR